MSKHMGSFSLYAVGQPPKLEIWCSDTFRNEVRALFAGASAADRASLANINAVVMRLAGGGRLSSDTFRREQDGYAFRAGRLRFYGAFSDARTGAFVLSHPIIKRHQKLDPVDADRTARCVAQFDTYVRRSRP